MPEENLPAPAVMATCPHCRFRFRVVAHSHPVAHGASSESSVRPSEMRHGNVTSMPAENDLGQSANDPKKPESSLEKAHTSQSEDTPYPPQSIANEGSFSEEEQKANQRDISSESPSSGSKEKESEQEDEEVLSADETRNPWENPSGGGGYIAAFFQTALRVMLAAPQFFYGLKGNASQVRPLIFYLLVSVLQITMERFWGGVISDFLAESAAADSQLQQLLAILSPKMDFSLILLQRLMVMTLELYFAAVIFYLIANFIAKERASFSLLFQVVAYSGAPMLLSVVPMLGSGVGVVWSVVCSVIGCRYALRISWPQAFTVVLPLYLIIIPLLIRISLGALVS